jgi:hypothetical protein
MTDRDELGVRGRVVRGLAQVVTTANDVAACVSDHGTDRHLARRHRQPSLIKGEAH